jgi:hypothetical protein
MNDVFMETPLSMIVSIGEIKHAGTAKMSTYCSRCLCHSFFQSPVIVAIPFFTSRSTEIIPLETTRQETCRICYRLVFGRYS